MTHLLLPTLILILSTTLTINGLDNGQSLTPPMGWMSWAIFFCEIDCIHHPYTCISQQLYMDMADHMVSDGYSAVGYKGVHIDDCWMEHERDDQGVLIANATRFPDGIQKLSKYMHSRGLLMGIYEDYGTKTCGGYPGSMGHLEMDANTFAKWEVDYLKLDGCYAKLEDYPKGYPAMTKFLNATGRPIVYSCSWPAYVTGAGQDPPYATIAKNCNLWRNYDDIFAEWKSIAGIINYYDHHQDELAAVHGPGNWNDPDMLVIGQPSINVDMAQSQMAIWSMWSAPLIMSNDLRHIAPEFQAILQNRKVIAVDQDPLGKFGKLVVNTTNVGVYRKPMTPFDKTSGQYSFAFTVLNRNLLEVANVQTTMAQLNMTNPSGYFVENLFTNEKLGLVGIHETISSRVNPTGVSMYKATIAQGFTGYLYEPEHLFNNKVDVVV